MSKITGLPKIKGGTQNLTYVNSTHLAADVTVGTDWNGCVPALTIVEISGTAYDAVTNLNYVPIANGKLHITAKGSGFVSGHIVQVAYIIFKL